ncbi:DNA repair protein RecN [Citricoccus nitrophenolicus]|uniref:DNA repair protein RecN n=1 Tax=Citricoccus muralis TaxID=169134 RepID=A0A3D9LAM2_9MICC|nr:DNA repair protein RecN [Citricoccus muralis]REE03419.1 DNA replication and repair protein RecN [Citricoccus muralis]
MIEYLSINGLGVIGDAAVELDPGFTVVTGETGAGKTMVVTALNLLLGARADAGAVRHGASRATVEAGFRLNAGHAAVEIATDAGAVLDEETPDRGARPETDAVPEASPDVGAPAGSRGDVALVVTRSVGAAGSSGRSRASAGGRGVPVALLGELGEHLVAVHGQTDQLRLKSPAAQRHALDSFAGSELTETLSVYQRDFEAWRRAAAELEEITSNEQDRAREAENLQRSLEEIDNAAVRAGEDEEVRALIQRLENVEELRAASLGAHTHLAGGDAADAVEIPSAEALIEAARQSLLQAPGQDDELTGLSQRLAEVGILLADVSGDLAGYAARLDDDAASDLDSAQSRLAELTRLMRLYGPELTDVIRWAETHRPRLEALQGDTGRIEELTAEVARLEQHVLSGASELTRLRTAGAATLSGLVSEELHALSMPDATFHATVTAGGQPGPHGADEVQLLLQPHAGAEPRPLGKGASGGELSRVMLALEVVLAATDPVPTFVFDEVDAGVGGEAAVQIGRRLARLAGHVQVIVVTHLPQVAAFADRHLKVTKNSDGDAGFTTSDVASLEGEERVGELARMLAGRADSGAARDHARELLEASHA